jgi:excisionase family DNA binding protein
MDAPAPARALEATPKRLSYSLLEATRATSLSRRTLEYLIKNGKLRAIKVGRRTLIPAKALERLASGE